MKTSQTFRATPPPHLRDGDNLLKIYWGNTAALLPLWVLSVVFFHFQALQVLFVSLAAAAGADYLAAKSFKRKARLSDGAALWSAAVYALLVPCNFPPFYAALGIFIAILIRELLGGRGISFVNTALIGNAFLQMTVPSFYRTAGSGLFFLDSGGLPSWLTLLALFFGAALILGRKILEWEIPLFYIVPVILLEKIFPSALHLSIRHVLFAAFFLLPEPGTQPLTRAGRKIAALLAGIFAWNLDVVSTVPVPETFAVLCANILTPWIDQWVLPAGAAKTQESAKA
jgi:electron transport complex protein RnfD